MLVNAAVFYPPLIIPALDGTSWKKRKMAVLIPGSSPGTAVMRI
jgi:hypothetical protein